MKTLQALVPTSWKKTGSSKLQQLRYWVYRNIHLALTAFMMFQSDSFVMADDTSGMPPAKPAAIRAGVLSSAKEPGRNTSQGLFISILRDGGFEARAVSADDVKAGALDELDIFIIGGGSGTAFNASLGEEGGRLVMDFVKKGGGVLASCAGGYSFVRGHNEALKYIEIANARCIDTEGGRWARGRGVVEIIPENSDAPTRKMFYANGPLWEITDAPGFGRIAPLARFKTDIKQEGDEGGIMPGTPAILAGSYFDGRFVLFSAHPEFHRELGANNMIVDAAYWVTRGTLSRDEQIIWSNIFTSKAPEPMP